MPTFCSLGKCVLYRESARKFSQFSKDSHSILTMKQCMSFMGNVEAAERREEEAKQSLMHTLL